MRTLAWWLGLLATMAHARELDPSACASRFDVQKNKIIRTEESREMGARYLSELDVGTRQECLRLCCETDSCDVFVYEEKSPGSCYLFNCGPPEDFRCKFTAHGNFSSGVLALSRHLAELQDQERLNHHEQELANLRFIKTTTTSTSTASTPTPRPVAQLPHPHPTTRRCSRYQFECHTGGECIAVYNACDGIPQCADGSDEAPELGCPSAPPLEPQPAATTTVTTPPPPKIVQETPEAVVSDSVAMAEPALDTERWPHRLTQAQSQHRYTETAPSSHIFSHKGGLLQETDNAAMQGNMMNQYPAFENPWQRRPWTQPAQGMEASDHYIPGGAYPRYEWPEPDPRRAWPVPQRVEPQEMPVYMPPKTMSETMGMYSNQQHTLRDSPKKGFDLMPKQIVQEIMTEKPKTPPVRKISAPAKMKELGEPDSTTKKKELKVESVVSKESAASAGAARGGRPEARHQLPADDHDGLSEHPPAAIMLLVLGVLMTSVLAVLVGSRARAARRRLRRGKSALAHDADYLVNGMYL